MNNAAICVLSGDKEEAVGSIILLRDTLQNFKPYKILIAM